MELRVLRYYLLAAGEENITKAAELLHEQSAAAMSGMLRRKGCLTDRKKGLG